MLFWGGKNWHIYAKVQLCCEFKENIYIKQNHIMVIYIWGGHGKIGNKTETNSLLRIIWVTMSLKFLDWGTKTGVLGY